MHVGERIRQLRKKKRLRQQTLAGMVGITPGALTNFEKGRRRVSLDWLERIADALDTPVTYFLGEGRGSKKIAAGDPREKRLLDAWRLLKDNPTLRDSDSKQGITRPPTESRSGSCLPCMAKIHPAHVSTTRTRTSLGHPPWQERAAQNDRTRSIDRDPRRPCLRSETRAQTDDNRDTHARPSRRTLRGADSFPEQPHALFFLLRVHVLNHCLRL